VAAAARNNENKDTQTDRGALQSLTNQNATIMKELADMRSMFMQFKTDGAVRPPPATRRPGKDHGSYCWSHGYLVIKDHTSLTCNKKKPGHQDAATRENNMGGNQFSKPKA
jgi:hypothetical protein